MEALFFISLAICIGYYILVLSKFGLPSALSQSAYLFGDKGKIIFPAVIGGMAVILMPFWLEITYGQWNQFMIFLSIIGMLMVAVTPRFKGTTPDSKGTMHFVGAVTACVLVPLWAMFTFPDMIIPVIIGAAIAIAIGKVIPGKTRDANTKKIYHNDNSVFFWLQILAFATAFYAIARIAWQ